MSTDTQLLFDIFIWSMATELTKLPAGIVAL